jgi:hypothetical protein
MRMRRPTRNVPWTDRQDQDSTSAAIHIANAHIEAAIALRGYVSGVRAGSFLDKKTGARDLSFGLAIADFLLEPAPREEQPAPGQYEFGNLVHGDIPKRYVEGPQICTQARHLPARVAVGPDFVAVSLRFRWDKAYAPHANAGSRWEQTLIVPDDARYFLASDRVTTVSESPALFLRLDMPGHVRHEGGSGFDHVYLSYHEPAILPSTEFAEDFPPDARFLYRRGDGPMPRRFIRASQVDLGPRREEGPWLAGMTLEPSDVYEAWCHQRGYVCMIEEIGGRPTRPGDTFGACYVVGWFDDIEAMHAAYDRHRGWSGLALDGPAERPTGFRGLRREDLTPVPDEENQREL